MTRISSGISSGMVSLVASISTRMLSLSTFIPRTSVRRLIGVVAVVSRMVTPLIRIAMASLAKGGRAGDVRTHIMDGAHIQETDKRCHEMREDRTVAIVHD